MTCENCGKEMIKVGTLEEHEVDDVAYVNEKFNCAMQSLNMEVLKDLEFTDGQVFEYFKAAYDQLAQAKYLQFIFERDLKRRLKVDEPIFIDYATYEVFVHPKDEEESKNIEE